MKRVVVAMLLAACGGGDGAHVDAPSDTGPGADGRPDELFGSVQLIQTHADGVDTTVTTASFAYFYGSVTARDVGPCHVEVLAADAVGNVSAGAVVATHGSERVEVDPDGSKSYGADVVHELRFAAGDEIDVAAMGADLPHFTASVVFPADVTVTAPTASVDVSRSGFDATWTSTADEVHVVLANIVTNASTSIDCTFAGSDGAGHVPAAAMSDLTAGDDLSIVIAAEARGHATAGPYGVDVLAAAYGVQLTGTVTE